MNIFFNEKINFRSRQYSKEEWFDNFAGEQCEYDVFWPDPTNHKLLDLVWLIRILGKSKEDVTQTVFFAFTCKFGLVLKVEKVVICMNKTN